MILEDQQISFQLTYATKIFCIQMHKREKGYCKKDSKQYCKLGSHVHGMSLGTGKNSPQSTDECRPLLFQPRNTYQGRV